MYAIQHTNETYTSDNCDGEDDDNDGVDGGGSSFKSDGRYYSMKRLDKLSTTVLKNALKFTGTVSVAGEAKEILNNKKELQSSPDQHHPDILIANDAYNLAILDPLVRKSVYSNSGLIWLYQYLFIILLSIFILFVHPQMY